MATVTIVITDQGDEGAVSVAFDYGKRFDTQSEAHRIAAELAIEFKEEDQPND